MHMTPAQLATLKGDILGDPTLAAHASNGAVGPIVAWYNSLTAAYWVWRTAVEKKEVVQQVSQDGTSFVWAGNGFISRSAGEIACWEQLFNSSLICNPSLANVRQAFSDIFSGTGNAALNRAHLLVVGRRKANNVEELFAVGSGTTASPSLITFEGLIDDQDVQAALALP